jgi:hypothetical protein
VNRPAGRLRRALCAGVPTFGGAADPLRPPLPFVPERVAAVARALRAFGYDTVETTDAGTLTAAGLPATIRAAAGGMGPDDVLVVHVVTHGHLTADGALYLYGGDGTFHEDGQIDHFARQLGHFDGPRVLLLLDVCHAGAVTRQPWQFTATNDRCWVLAACAPDSLAFNGRFSEAVANVLDGFGSGGAHVGATRAHLPFAMVAAAVRREVRRLVDRDDAMPQEVTGTLRDVTADPPDPPFFPNPASGTGSGRRARAVVAPTVEPFLADVDEALDPVHFMNRAGGRIAAGAPTDGPGCFSGRNQELRALTEWCDGAGSRLRVVTGSPGAGKSALVGVVVCAAHPELHRPTERLWRDVAWAPVVNPRLVAVHARRRTVGQIVSSLAVQLDLPVRDEWTVPGFLEAVAALDVPPFIVVDALDEAHRHEQVLDALLLPLARDRRPDGGPLSRLLVGMRPWPVFDELRQLAGKEGGLVDLDRVDRGRLEVDLDNYVVNLLRHHAPYDHRDFSAARGAFAAHLADALVSGADEAGPNRWGEFLVAGLYTYHVATAHPPVSDFRAAAELGAAAPRTLPALLELDLSTRTNPWLRPVLTVIAYTHGEGMPAELIVDAAAAFPPAGVETAGALERNRIGDALNTVRFYLRAGTDVDGSTLYRLFHQGLADHLRQGPDLAGPLVTALLRPLEAMDGRGRRWDLAEPYLRRHAAAHCLDAGRLDLLADDVEFLVHGDPAAVETLVEPGAVEWLDGWEHRHLRAGAGASARGLRYALAVHARATGCSAAADRLADPPGGRRLFWSPAWAVRPRVAEEEPGLITGEPVASFRLVKVSGQPYLIVLTAGGELSVWGSSGRCAVWFRSLPPVEGPGAYVLRVLEGRGLVLIEHGSRVVRVLTVRSGHPVSPDAVASAEITGDAVRPGEVRTESGVHRLEAAPDGGIRILRSQHPGWVPAGWQPTELPVRALTAVAAGPWLHIAYADDRSVRVLKRNLRKDRPAADRVVGAAGNVRELAGVLVGGELLVAARGSALRVWPVPEKPPRWPACAVMRMAVAAGTVAVGLADGTVARYSAATGATISCAPVHESPVGAITIGPGDLTATVDLTGTAAVVDWASGRTLYRGVVVPTVRDATLTMLGGRLVLLAAAAGRRLAIVDVLAGRTAVAEGFETGTTAPPAGDLEVQRRGSAVRVVDPATDRLLDRIELGDPVDEVIVLEARRLLLRTSGLVIMMVPAGDQA